MVLKPLISIVTPPWMLALPACAVWPPPLTATLHEDPLLLLPLFPSRLAPRMSSRPVERSCAEAGVKTQLGVTLASWTDQYDFRKVVYAGVLGYETFPLSARESRVHWVEEGVSCPSGITSFTIKIDCY